MIEYWNQIALIADDRYFTKWVKESGKLCHHDGFLNYLEPYLHGVILDIGANIGTHTHFYAQRGTVYAFEPNWEAYECLCHNLKGFPNTHLLNVAVGNQTGTVHMSDLEDGNYGAMFTLPGGVTEVITIDSLHLHQCNFIKVDVEGDEVAVLEGAKQTILTHRPVMCIESNPHTLARKGLTPNDLIATIHNLGYTCKQRVPPDISADLLCLPN